MASGPTIGEDNGPRDKQRYIETRVYTRKAKGLKNKANAVNAIASAVDAANTTSTIISTVNPAGPAIDAERNDSDSKKVDISKNLNGDSVSDKEAVDDAKDGANSKDHENNVSIQPVTGDGVQENGNLTQQPPDKRVDITSNDLRRQQDDPSSIIYNLRDESRQPLLQDELLTTNRLPQNAPLNIDHHREDEPSNIDHHPGVEPPVGHHCYQGEPPTVNPSQLEEPPVSNRHQQDVASSTGYFPSGNGFVRQGSTGVVMVNDLGSRSKQERRELRRKLENDLHSIRSLVSRVEAKQGEIGGYGNSTMVMNERVNNGVGAKRSHSEVASGELSREITRPLHQLNVSVMENIRGSEVVEKEKRTPKANQFYRNSEFLLGKDKFPPADSNRKSKSHGRKQHGGGEIGHAFGVGTKFWKSCSSLLEKLMKHKHGWVFNAPVDAKALGLLDYHRIISHPMDLGTVKSRLSTNWYKSIKEFAEDVRLTFRNAMVYNPKGQDVHIMAEQLSSIFEDRWTVIESDYNREIMHALEFGTGLATPTAVHSKVAPFRPAPLNMRRILDRSKSMGYSADRAPKPMTFTPSSRTPAPKKPKANDPDKRDMTFEEKQKLSTNLQSLPSEKLDAIVQIIKRRNSSLFQLDDEIEVDIDSVDAETLWELDRFVSNYKKSLSKYKRKAKLAFQARAEAMQSVSERGPAVASVPQENVAAPLPAQVEKQVDDGNRSSSSSSSSSDSGSSSSDSDSESSSASGSGASAQRS